MSTRQARINPAGQRIALGGRIHVSEWLCGTRAGQGLLGEARRARCMCVEGGVEMYVAQRDETRYLSRMPGTGLLHHPDCPSFEDINLFSGAPHYAVGSLTELADGSLSILFNPGAPRSPSPVAFGLDGLLDLLLETAGLNVHAANEPERGWRLARERIAAAAATITLKGTGALSAFLVLPDGFDKDLYEVQRAAHETFLSVADETRLVCAPLRGIRPTPYGWQLVLKHMPGTRFWLSRAVGDAIADRAGGTLACGDAQYPALCLLHTKPAKNSGFTVLGGALRRTDRHYIPCLSVDENEVAGRLAGHHRHFMRPLRFDIPWEQPLADYALLDDATPTPIFVLGKTGSDALDGAKRTAAHLLVRYNRPCYLLENSKWFPNAPC